MEAVQYIHFAFGHEISALVVCLCVLMISKAIKNGRDG